MVLKCTECGGDLVAIEGSLLGECENCGRTSVIPKDQSQRKTDLYNRASDLYRGKDFIRASKAYEDIISEDAHEPEAYWGLVQCEYELEHILDEKTGEYVLTCNKPELQSILTSVDYKTALKYSDGSQRKVYEEKAQKVHDIQVASMQEIRGEKAYDVFISFKNEDSAKQLTIDSQKGFEIYQLLTNKMGYNVFFSRVTLKDAVGKNVEPLIYAALKTAKVMIVIGSEREYLLSPWVQNEWSRYISLMKTDENRIIIPLFDGDHNSLPHELSSFQGMNMNGIGYDQEIATAVQRHLKRTAPEEASIVSVSGPTTSSKFVRGKQFLASGNFEDAAKYFNDILDIDSSNAEYHWHLYLAKNKSKTGEELVNRNTVVSKYHALIDGRAVQDISSEDVHNAIYNDLELTHALNSKEHQETYSASVSALETEVNAILVSEQARLEHKFSRENSVNNMNQEIKEKLALENDRKTQIEDLGQQIDDMKKPKNAILLVIGAIIGGIFWPLALMYSGIRFGKFWGFIVSLVILVFVIDKIPTAYGAISVLIILIGIGLAWDSIRKGKMQGQMKHDLHEAIANLHEHNEASRKHVLQLRNNVTTLLEELKSYTTPQF